MQEGTTGQAEVVRLRQSIETQMRRRILEAIEVVLEEELTEALGTGRYERGEARRGYRNGHERRRITTAVGTETLAVPRGRVTESDGSSREFRSEALPRYARRTREVDEAILGAYLAGANTRRIRKALAPLLGEEHLSKSAVSRVASRLKDLFRRWSERDVSQERYAILFLDGFHLKVRMARRVVSVPVLAMLGVAEDGTKHLVALQLAASEAGSHWSNLIADLQRRGLKAPALILSDGHAGLRKALELWPEAQVQRCTWHKWQNLVAHCPAHARRELKLDYDAIVYAEDGMKAREATRPSLGSGRSCAPRWPGASRKRASSCSPSTPSRSRCGERCARRTRWRTSTGSSGAGPRRRPRSRPRRRGSSCSPSTLSRRRGGGRCGPPTRWRT